MIPKSLGVLAIMHNDRRECTGKTKLDFVNNAFVTGQHEVTCAHAQTYAHPVCVLLVHAQ